MAAGTPTHQHQPIRIGDPALNQRVDAGDDVEGHVLEVVTDDIAKELVAVPGAAAIIWPQHQIAFCCQHRNVIHHETRARTELVRFKGPAVHLHDDRIFPGRIELEGIEQHAFDSRSVVADPLELLLTGQDEVALQPIVGIRHPCGRGLLA